MEGRHKCDWLRYNENGSRSQLDVDTVDTQASDLTRQWCFGEIARWTTRLNEPS